MAKTLYSPSSRETAPITSAESFSLIPREKLIDIYITIVKCRLLQQRAGTLFQQGALDADLHGLSGSEASAAAVCADLQPEDAISIMAGDWLPAFAKGLPAETLLRALTPKVNGNQQAVTAEAQRRNILIADKASDQPRFVLERAEEAKAKNQPGVIVAFLPPRSGLAGWQKAMTAASAKRLPIIFVQPVRNEGESEPAAGEGRNRNPQALVHGLPAIAVDASDPIALYRVAYEAITRARQHRGATLIRSYLIASGSVPGGPGAPPPDAVVVMESYLKGKGIQPEPSIRQVADEFARELDLATRFLEH